MYFGLFVNSNMDFFFFKVRVTTKKTQIESIKFPNQQKKKKKRSKKIKPRQEKRKKGKQEHSINTKFRGEKINNKLSRIKSLIKYQIEF